MSIANKKLLKTTMCTGKGTISSGNDSDMLLIRNIIDMCVQRKETLLNSFFGNAHNVWT
jgi:hypothetical protein